MQAELGQRMPDGATMREHLLAAARAGHSDERLTVRLQSACKAIWSAFVDLSGSRPSGMGVSAIPPSEILAWCSLYRVRLTPWEIETLQAMDRATISKHQQLKAKKA